MFTYLPPRPLSPSILAAAGRQLVIVRAAAYASDSVSSYFSMACYSIVSYLCK